MGILYLVSTPIGNLEDITLRALRVLREVALIAAEDTRHTRRLLQHYEITTPCMAYHEHNKLARLDAVLAALADGDVALVSDAGTPALSDPGYELVRACIAADVDIQPVPGPNAPLAALVASGLPTERFFYLGFLPRRSSERRALFGSVADVTATLICFETPHRLCAALADALAVLGNRQMVAARELTKLHEEWLRLPISAVLAHFEQTAPRGELTLVLAGADPAPTPDPAALEAQAMHHLAALRSQGERGSSAARRVAKDLGLPRSDVYQLWLRLEHPPAAEDDPPEPV